MARRKKKTEAPPVKIEFSTGKRCYDSGTTRYLLRDMDGTCYARRCLGCGQADKVYQSTHHNWGCPIADKHPTETWAFFVCQGDWNDPHDCSDPDNLLSGGFPTWGEADAYAAQIGNENAFVKFLKVGPTVQIDPEEADKFFSQD